MAATAMADQFLESRVARLESDVAHIRSDMADMKVDIREMRKDISAMDKKIADLDHKLTRGLASARIWTLLLAATILGVMARGFGWL